MVDPLAIPALAIAVAGVCLNIALFIDDCSQAHSTWRCFHAEIKALERVLRSIESSFDLGKDDDRTGDAADSTNKKTEIIDSQHVLDVKLSLENCQQTLGQFETLLHSIKVEERHKWFSRPLQQFKLGSAAETMTILRSQVGIYTQTLQISLQMLTMRSSQKNGVASAHLVDMVRQLLVEIRTVQAQIKGAPPLTTFAIEEEPHPSTLDYENSEIMTNLEKWARSARGVVSTTSSLLGSRTDLDHFDLRSIEESLSIEKRGNINTWVAQCSDDTEEIKSLSGSNAASNFPPQSWTETVSSTIEDPSDADCDDDSDFFSDEEDLHIERLLQSSAAKENASDYSGAEQDLREAITRLEKESRTRGTPFKEQAQMWELLISLLCKQDKLDEAAQVLEKHIRAPKSSPDQPWRFQHRLAEIYVVQGKLDQADKLCNKARKGRRMEHGEKSPEFEESVILCHKIWSLIDKKEKAKTLEQKYPHVFAHPLSTIVGLTSVVLAPSTPLAQSSARPVGAGGSEREGSQRKTEMSEELGFGPQTPAPDIASAVNSAFSKGLVPRVQQLLKENRGNQGASMLEAATIITAAILGNLPMMKGLLKIDVDIEAKGVDGCTPLHKAVANGHETVVKFLLEHEADVHAINPLQSTALHFAIDGKKLSMVKLLIQHGAVVDSYALEEAKALSSEIYKYLLKKKKRQ